VRERDAAAASACTAIHQYDVTHEVRLGGHLQLLRLHGAPRLRRRRRALRAHLPCAPQPRQ
jgi:hypothetical protein